MGYGSNAAVKDAEDEHREQLALQISRGAAALVAAGDMDRTGAIKALTEWHREESAAAGDSTGTASINNRYPTPSKRAPDAQIAAISTELMDHARDAADSI